MSFENSAVMHDACVAQTFAFVCYVFNFIFAATRA